MRELFPSLTAGIAAIGRGLWFVTRRVGRAMLYLLPALILVHIIATVITGRQLQRDMTRLRAAGILLPAKELIPTLPPGAENAAPVYEKAWNALRFSVEDERALFDQGVKHDAKWLALARRVVAANPEYYRLLDQASVISHCVFPVDWTSPTAAVFPHFNQLSKAARMLTLRANVEAADGQIEAALDSVTTIARVAQHAKSDAIIISELLSYAIQDMAVSTLEEVLSRGTSPPSTCKSLYEELGKLDNSASSLRVMKGEVGLLMAEVFDLVRSGKVSLDDLCGGESSGGSFWGRSRSLIRVRAWLWRPLFNADQRVNLAHMERQIRAAELPWPESERTIQEDEDRLNQRPPVYAVLTRMVTPVFGGCILRRDRATAAIRAAQVALALKVYQAEHGALPASLSDLEQAGWRLPRDPFGDGEYRFRREGGGFVVWSIGPDMQDGNASRDFRAYANLPLTAAERKKNPYDYDVIFRCTR